MPGAEPQSGEARGRGTVLYLPLANPKQNSKKKNKKISKKIF